LIVATPKNSHLIVYPLQNGILANIFRYFAIPVLYIKKSILNTTQKILFKNEKFLSSEGSRGITTEHLLEAVDGRGKTEVAEFAAALARATAANAQIKKLT
jgi:hypothetical protein